MQSRTCVSVGVCMYVCIPACVRVGVCACFGSCVCVCVCVCVCARAHAHADTACVLVHLFMRSKCQHDQQKADHSLTAQEECSRPEIWSRLPPPDKLLVRIHPPSTPTVQRMKMCKAKGFVGIDPDVRHKTLCCGMGFRDGRKGGLRTTGPCQPGCHGSQARAAASSPATCCAGPASVRNAALDCRLLCILACI
jgi:hypothetical protein